MDDVAKFKLKYLPQAKFTKVQHVRSSFFRSDPYHCLLDGVQIHNTVCIISMDSMQIGTSSPLEYSAYLQ